MRERVNSKNISESDEDFSIINRNKNHDLSSYYTYQNNRSNCTSDNTCKQKINKLRSC